MTEKILNILKNSNDFISGEKIAQQLNVSRMAVCKNIAKLKQMGYNIISTTNKGYLLVVDNNLFNKIEIEKEINTFVLGKNIYFFDEITSTNEYAKTIANNVEEGTIVVAKKQTKGKGRLDRKWISSKNEGIYFSLILKPEIEVFKIMQITLIAGISLCETIKQMANIDAKIKWPNDILINNKKVCGILTELNAQIDNIFYIILGIGINVNNEKFDQDLKQKATSLYLETNKNIEKQKILACFLKNFEQKYFIYKKEKSFDPFLKQYKDLCVNLNKKAKILHKGKEIIGEVIDISHLGEIVFKTDTDILKISSGEVSLRNVDGEYV